VGRLPRFPPGTFAQRLNASNSSAASRLPCKLSQARSLVGETKCDVPPDLGIRFAGVGIDMGFVSDRVRVVRAFAPS
jgi:hypothetical protein